MSGPGYVRPAWRRRALLHGISGALIISIEQSIARGVDEARICRDFGVTPEQYAAIEKHMREDD